jgi:zinc transport system substrate-binding protein
MSRSARWILFLGTTVALICCTHGEQAQDGPTDAVEKAPPLAVYVVNYPLQYFAERLGGEVVEVILPAPADSDPAYWSPDAEVIAAYQAADLILLNGAGYAKWVGRASLRRAKLVDTSVTFRDRYIALEESVTHAHGPQGEHAHEGKASTTWLDPTLAIEHARAIAEAFTKTRPEHGAAFRQWLKVLEADLRRLDERLTAVANTIGDTPLVFSHPVYQYFIRRYAMNGRSVHWEPDELPSERMWHELEELLESHAARWMIWEGVPMDAVAQRLEDLGLRSIVYAPCGNVPEEGNFLTTMQRNVDGLEAAFVNRASEEQ